MFESWLYVGVAIVAAAGARALWVSLSTLVVVRATETVWVVRRGLRLDPLSPGVHRFFGKHIEVHRYDRRATELKVTGQEILTRDSVTVKASVLARYRIADAVRFAESSENALAVFYSDLQVALRGAVMALELEPLLSGRAELGQRLMTTVAPNASPLGLVVEAVQVIDVMLCGELKRAMAQVAQTRAEGKAALERARAESAALRSMANAARMLKDNEGLRELRSLQVAELAAGSTGNTLVFGVDMPPKPKA
ncbi:MAG: slipin family protein [Planctomycetota bacterium]